jgi:VIT1/CCC1 family predicted Fe2+/Mn2+ transporter
MVTFYQHQHHLVSSLGESKSVVLAGLAELIAWATSMGIGGFLASQEERDHARYVREQMGMRIGRTGTGDRMLEGVLVVVGVEESVCNEVMRSLKEVEVRGGRDGRDEETVRMRWRCGVATCVSPQVRTRIWNR